jgi:hypothetical protein
VHHSGKHGLRPCSQILDQPEWTCQGQTPNLLATNIKIILESRINLSLLPKSFLKQNNSVKSNEYLKGFLIKPFIIDYACLASFNGHFVSSFKFLKVFAVCSISLPNTNIKETKKKSFMALTDRVFLIKNFLVSNEM